MSMRIKKFTAKSMKEALMQIKQELGEDAIILKTNHIPGKLFASGDIEVTAAIDEDGTVPHQTFAPLRVSNSSVYKRQTPAMPQPEMPQQPPKKSEPSGSVKPFKFAMSDESINRRKAMLSPTHNAVPKHDENIDKKYEAIKADITELKQMFKSVVKPQTPAQKTEFTGEWSTLYNKLVEAEVYSDIAHDFVGKIKNESVDKGDDALKCLLGELGSCFQKTSVMPVKKHGPYTIMFVGPTGSGKTTTLAKLAAHHSLSRNKSVAVITADTYRIAAIEQIRTFTDIMNMELRIVFTPDEARTALDELNKYDIVCIDTAGRSQKSSEHMDELQLLISKVVPDEIQLVLSATTKVSDLTSIIDKYKKLGINRLLFTKLDETVKLGNVFTSGIQSKIPFSYFTFGQRVPDDIELAQPKRLVQRLFEGSVV